MSKKQFRSRILEMFHSASYPRADAVDPERRKMILGLGAMLGTSVLGSGLLGCLTKPDSEVGQNQEQNPNEPDADTGPDQGGYQYPPYNTDGVDAYDQEVDEEDQQEEPDLGHEPDYPFESDGVAPDEGYIEEGQPFRCEGSVMAVGEVQEDSEATFVVYLIPGEEVGDDYLAASVGVAIFQAPSYRGGPVEIPEGLEFQVVEDGSIQWYPMVLDNDGEHTVIAELYPAGLSSFGANVASHRSLPQIMELSQAEGRVYLSKLPLFETGE
jgi:hypothetical protein